MIWETCVLEQDPDRHGANNTEVQIWTHVHWGYDISLKSVRAIIAKQTDFSWIFSHALLHNLPHRNAAQSRLQPSGTNCLKIVLTSLLRAVCGCGEWLRRYITGYDKTHLYKRGKWKWMSRKVEQHSSESQQANGKRRETKKEPERFRETFLSAGRKQNLLFETVCDRGTPTHQQLWKIKAL